MLKIYASVQIKSNLFVPRDIMSGSRLDVIERAITQISQYETPTSIWAQINKTSFFTSDILQLYLTQKNKSETFAFFTR